MAALWRTLILIPALLALALCGCQSDANGTSSAPRGLVFDAGWDDPDNPLAQKDEWTEVSLGGETFTVALALEGDDRQKGLGDVPDIPEDRGMLFVFSQNLYLEFVMRDCLVDIDIAYLTDRGTVGKMYTMKVEPRNEGETDLAYESRLKRYKAGFASRMALELPAGTLERLGVGVGDEVTFKDLDALKRMAN